MICSVFNSGVEIKDMLPTDKFFSVFLKTICFSRCPLPKYTHKHIHTRARTHTQTITFYLLSRIRILNHISISLPSFISNIYSHSHTNHSLCLCIFLSPILPAYSRPHLVTALVKYECAQWSVVVWSAALTMSFVSGLNRKLSSHSEAQAEVHTIWCNSENNTKQTLTLFTGALFDPNDSRV